MITLTSIVNGALQQINESIIDDLMNLGYSHDNAVKVVTEFDGYNFSEDAMSNPIDF